MVGVIIIDHRTVVLTLVLKPAACSAEGVQALSNGLHGDIQLQSGSGGGQRIAHVVDAGHTQGDGAQSLTLVDQIKGG